MEKVMAYDALPSTSIQSGKASISMEIEVAFLIEKV
jgi:hypothetical protein